MANELEIGTRRTGDFIDFYEETPEVKVLLERTEEGISVTLPWSGLDSPYAGWFMGDDFFQGLPKGEAKAEPKPIPKRVLFHDSRGSLLLTRCWARGFHINVFGPGSGTLWSSAAIMDVGSDIEFDKPHGLQTEISGLREWLGVSSWEEKYDWSSGLTVGTFTSKAPSTIAVGEHGPLSLSFNSGWKVLPADGRDQRVLLNTLRCVTRGEDAQTWADHMQQHRAVRDLLVVSRWHKESCVELSAMRRDDPDLGAQGDTVREQWRTVVVPNDERAAPPKGYRPHLIRYDELGPAGILAWLQLRDDFSRALDPVITSKDLGTLPASTRLAHTGPGLEALGYLLLLEDGVSGKDAKNAILKDRLARIVADLGNTLPFVGQDWIDATADAYNGIKHANRVEPDEVDVMNAWRRSVLVVRAWIALRLVVPATAVQERLKDDPQAELLVRRV